MVGAAILLIGALTILTLGSMKNSQSSKNQVQATKLAQEALEQVRIIRDRDHTVCTLNNNPSSCVRFSNYWSYSCTAYNNCTYVVESNPARCSATADPTITSCLNQVPSAETVTGGFFKRLVTIYDIPSDPDQKRIKAVVSWQDTTGTHQSELVTILAKR